MKALKELRRKLAVRNFRKKIAGISFPHAGVGLAKAKKVGILVNVTESQPKELIALTDFIGKLEEAKKQIFLIEINLSRKAEPMFNETRKSLFLNRKNVNWLGLPSREAMKEINNQQLDILLDFDNSEILTSRFIAGFSNARTRVGIFDTEFWENYDVALDIPRGTRIKSIIGGYETYLKMLEQ